MQNVFIEATCLNPINTKTADSIPKQNNSF